MLYCLFLINYELRLRQLKQDFGYNRIELMSIMTFASHADYIFISKLHIIIGLTWYFAGSDYILLLMLYISSPGWYKLHRPFFGIVFVNDKTLEMKIIRYFFFLSFEKNKIKKKNPNRFGKELLYENRKSFSPNNHFRAGKSQRKNTRDVLPGRSIGDQFWECQILSYLLFC